MLGLENVILPKLGTKREGVTGSTLEIEDGDSNRVEAREKGVYKREKEKELSRLVLWSMVCFYFPFAIVKILCLFSLMVLGPLGLRQKIHSLFVNGKLNYIL